MRLRLAATDRDPFWIIGDPALSARGEMSLALNERIQVTRNQQSVTGAEWDTQVHMDRKNQRVQLSANVRREFASEWERMDFMARLARLEPDEQLHRWAGDVWLRLDGADGATFSEWLLEDAVVAVAGTELDGAIGLRMAYTVSCGGFSGVSHLGTSMQFLLQGSTPAALGMMMSISELDALMAAATTPATDFFMIFVTVEYAFGAFTSYGNALVPPGVTPGFGEYALPLSSCGAAVAADLEDTFGIFSAMDFTVTDDVFSIVGTPASAFAYITVEIKHYYTDGYGSHHELIYSKPGEILQDPFRLTGTHAGTDDQLTGLIET
ncbi:hypothetical protein [Brevifollis gellanilyticus]|uniref:Uncharacterized protein n=1 Tax=Brevifollis gellanilyticus TaxID=748831 RepID=A0A512MHF8_9BACT|nr:hypothetical protein [Brevifollis gellanilyticus]GEP46173.1 hypothetical protein BGE01nite_54640 [Brevifollis gellanilyticus]